MTVIQAILLSKEFYDKNQAEAYIKRHKYKPIKKVRITTQYYRYRIKEPDYDLYDYRTITLKTGVKAIVGNLHFAIY